MSVPIFSICQLQPRQKYHYDYNTTDTQSHPSGERCDRWTRFISITPTPLKSAEVGKYSRFDLDGFDNEKLLVVVMNIMTPVLCVLSGKMESRLQVDKTNCFHFSCCAISWWIIERGLGGGALPTTKKWVEEPSQQLRNRHAFLRPSTRHLQG